MGRGRVSAPRPSPGVRPRCRNLDYARGSGGERVWAPLWPKAARCPSTDERRSTTRSTRWSVSQPGAGRTWRHLPPRGRTWRTGVTVSAARQRQRLIPCDCTSEVPRAVRCPAKAEWRSPGAAGGAHRESVQGTRFQLGRWRHPGDGGWCRFHKDANVLDAHVGFISCLCYLNLNMLNTQKNKTGNTIHLGKERENVVNEAQKTRSEPPAVAAMLLAVEASGRSRRKARGAT